MPFEVVREVPADETATPTGSRFEFVGEVRPPRPKGPATIGEQVAAKALAAANAFGEGTANLATGAAKGVGNTLVGLGELAYNYTPIGRVSDLISPHAFETPLAELQPHGTMQNLGYMGEQAAEFLIPISKVGKAAKAVEVGKAGLTSLAQTRSTGAAAGTAALTAAVPVVGRLAARLAPGLRASAEKTVAQALGATKEAMKAEAARLAPQMLDRGVRGSRAGMLAQASAQVRAVGQLIEDEVATQAAAGATVSGTQLRGAAQLAADALRVPDAAGTLIPIRGAEASIRELEALDDFVQQLGPDIPFDKAQTIKQTWQHIVSKAGLYGPKATATATDNAAASALREGAGVLREMLASGSATLDDLNREFAFWKGLKTVLTATQARTQAQAPGLTQSIAAGTGAVGGAMLGGPAGAGLGTVLTPAVVGALRSPWFRTTAAAPLKDAMAKALASGSQGQVQLAAARIVAAMPAALRTAMAQ